MNFVYMTDKEFMNSEAYKKFMKVNHGKGKLKIRAYAASEALPVGGLKIVVSTMINEQKVIFFEGVTDASGMIENLVLPAPELNLDNMEIPLATDYEIDAISFDGSLDKVYHVNMYDGICVVQNINYTPNSYGGDI